MSWLRELLDRAIAENMCVRYKCTTCGSTAFQHALLAGALTDCPQHAKAPGWTLAALKALACALAELDSLHPSDQQAVKFVIMHLHNGLGASAFTEEFAPGFNQSPAYKVFEAMQVHEAERAARRAEHDRRNNAEGIAAARARRKAAGEQRDADHRARKAARDALRQEKSDPSA